MHFDDLLTNYVGEMGGFQWKLIFAISMCLCLPVSWYTMGEVLMAAVPDHWCAVPALDSLGLPESEIKNLSIPITGYDSQGNPEYAQCSRHVRNFTDWNGNMQDAPTGNETEYCADGWKYSTDVYTSTVAAEFGIVCNKEVMLATASSVYQLGFLVGVVVVGIVSDYLGRKPTCIISALCLQAASVALSFVQSFPAYCLFRFLQAFFGLGAFTTGFVLCMEITGPNKRTNAGMVTHYTWTMAYLLYTIPAYFLRNWRTLNLVTTSIPCLALIILFYLPESPRWLYSKERPEKADVIVHRIAKGNKTTLPDPLVVCIKVDVFYYHILYLLVLNARIRV